MADIAKIKELDAIFNPKNIAIIGASAKPGIGNQCLKNLIDGGYQGALYPINPKGGEILGRKAYATINDIPGDVDMAVFCVKEEFCQDVAEQCAKKKVKSYIVITSGFSETGNKAGEEKLVKTALDAGGRVVGPNIVGVLMNPCKANASFAPCLPYNGRTALISQSGALLIALDMATFVRRLGVTSMISLGNMADVDFADCIEYYAQDKDTSAIALYVEGIKNGRRFLEAGRSAGKPIIAIKSGVSAHGAAAAASHTGSLAGSAKVYRAAFDQAHVVWANDLDDFLNKSQAMAMQPPMKGDNILVITNGGGIGVLASDAAEFHGVPLKPAPKDLQEEFKKCMPDFGSPKNPVDITGGAGLKGYQDAIACGLKSEWCSGLAVLYCETAVTKPVEIAEGVIKAIESTGIKDKPIVACFVGGEQCAKASELLGSKNIPMYDDPNKAMAALSALRTVARFQAEGSEPDFKADTKVDQKKCREIIAAARADGRSVLTEPEAKEALPRLRPGRHRRQGRQERRRGRGDRQEDRLPGRDEDRLAADRAQVGRRRREGQHQGRRGREGRLRDHPGQRQEVQGRRQHPRRAGAGDGAAGQGSHRRQRQRLGLRPDLHVRLGRHFRGGPQGRDLPRRAVQPQGRDEDAPGDQGLPHPPGRARREAPRPGEALRDHQPPVAAGQRPGRRDRRDRRQPDHALRRGQGPARRRRPHHLEEEVGVRGLD
ncbi:MAG: CoA-binding protein [Myxococcales bacterium]